MTQQPLSASAVGELRWPPVQLKSRPRLQIPISITFIFHVPVRRYEVLLLLLFLGGLGTDGRTQLYNRGRGAMRFGRMKEEIARPGPSVGHLSSVRRLASCLVVGCPVVGPPCMHG